MSFRAMLLGSLHFLVLVVFFSFSLLNLALPRLTLLREKIAQALLNHPESFTKVGIGSLLLTFLLFSAFYFLHRGRYLVIRMGIEANVKVVRRAIERCFESQFAKKIKLQDVEVGDGSELELKIMLAPCKEEEREALFHAVEKALAPLLKERFGYSKPFKVIAKT